MMKTSWAYAALLLMCVTGCGAASPSAPTNSAPQQQSNMTNATSSSTSANVPVVANVSPVQAGPCTTTSQFKHNQTVIIRIQITDPSTGRTLTNKELSSVRVLLPNNQVIDAAYGTHQGFMGNTRQFWTVPWTIPGNYPTGQVQMEVIASGTAGSTELKQTEIPLQNADIQVVS